jgi:hypothetical protein
VEGNFYCVGPFILNNNANNISKENNRGEKEVNDPRRIPRHAAPTPQHAVLLLLKFFQGRLIHAFANTLHQQLETQFEAIQRNCVSN